MHARKRVTWRLTGWNGAARGQPSVPAGCWRGPTDRPCPPCPDVSSAHLFCSAACPPGPAPHRACTRALPLDCAPHALLADSPRPRRPAHRTGTHFHLTHLDERVLEVASSGVIKPDSWACIRGEGMPIQGRPFEKGNLYIHFTGGCQPHTPTPHCVPFPPPSAAACLAQERAPAARRTFLGHVPYARCMLQRQPDRCPAGVVGRSSPVVACATTGHFPACFPGCLPHTRSRVPRRGDPAAGSSAQVGVWRRRQRQRGTHGRGARPGGGGGCVCGWVVWLGRGGRAGRRVPARHA